MEESYYYKEAKDAILWTRQMLTEENFSWLFSRPYSALSGDYGFFHSAPVHPSGFYYMVHEGDAIQQARVLDKLTRYTFIGHSHLTQSFLFNQKGIRDITGDNVVPGEEEKVIVTVGSVGQPRDRNPELCFVLLDTDTGVYEHVRLKYDVETTAGKIREAGLSDRFAERLFDGV
jgi:diadenosine tetraphosphatase ApaH/serine/threonine PP2A family protein phosphatase